MSAVWDKSSRYLTVILLVVLPLAFYRDTHVLMFGSFKESLARLIILALLCVTLVQVVFFQKAIRKAKLFWPLLLLFGYQTLSLSWAVNPYQGVEHLLHWGFLGIFLWVTVNTIRDTSTLRLCMQVSLLIATVSVWAATFGNPKFAAEYLSPLTLWAMALFYIDERRTYRLLYLGFVLLVVGTVLFVYKSRASMVGLSPLFLYWVYLLLHHMRLRMNKRVFVGVVAVGVLVGSMTFFVGATKINLLQKLQSGTILQRYTMWKNTLEMAEEHVWTGVGVGNFNIHYPRYMTPEDRFTMPLEKEWSPFVRQAHNEYLQFFAELGILGLILALIIWTIILGHIFLFFNRKRDARESKLVTMLLLSLGSSGLIGMFGFNFQNIVSSVYCVFSLSVVIALTTREEGTIQCPRFRWRALLIPAMVLSLVLFLRPLLRNSFGSYYRLRAMGIQDTLGRDSIRTLKKSLQWNANDWETHLALGSLYSDYLLDKMALIHFEKASELHPEYEIIQYNLGSALKKNGEVDRAIEVFQNLVKGSPDFRKANIQLGYLYLAEDNIPEAVRHFKHVFYPGAYQESSLVNAHKGLAVCYDRQGDVQKAMKEIREYLSHLPRNYDLIQMDVFAYLMRNQ